jgi:hypothetical protein
MAYDKYMSLFKIKVSTWIHLQYQFISYMNWCKINPTHSPLRSATAASAVARLADAAVLKQTSAAAASAIAIPAEDNAAVSTGTGRSAGAASAVERLADAAVATVTSADAASALATVVTPNVEYAAAGGTDISAATASCQANLAVGASTALGMMSATEKVAMPAGRVDDTGSNTSAIGAKGNLILLQGLAAATAVALEAFTAAYMMEGMDGGMAASPPCLSFLLGL